MSNSDTDELLNTGWFDSESKLTGISSVESTLALGVNMSCSSANQIQVRALGIGDSNTTGPAPNTGIPVGNVLLRGNGPIKGEFSIYPNPHSPSKQVTFTCPISPWVVHG